MRPIDYVLIIAIVAILVGIVIYLILNKKKGKTSCGCACANCPNAGKCGGVKQANEAPMDEVSDENT